MRFAYARFMQETNALSPVTTALSDFERSHYLDASALAAAVAPGGHEVAGFFKKAELAGFVGAATKAGDATVPVLSAWASSGGPLTRACFDALLDRLTDGLRRARTAGLDGVYLALHGAMGVVGLRDPETVILRAAREAAGDVPVVCTHDLHGNMTRERVAAAEAIIAYGTNPHRDHARCGRKAAELLAGIARGTVKPTTAWRSLPLLLGGGKTIDFLAPMRAVFRRMRAMERKGEALAASTFMVQPWIDEPVVGWSTLVVTNGDPAAADRLADELAEMCWARRHEQPPTFASPADALVMARKARLRRKLGVVTIAEASDVVTAGAPGDSTHLLRSILEDGAGLLTYAAVRDPAAIEELWPQSVGAPVSLSVGGKLDPSSSSPLPIRGTLCSKHDRPGFLRCAVVSTGDLRLVITEGPAMVMKPSFYTDLGLDLWKADIAVVKNFFPFLLFFLPYNRKTIFVRTQGVTDFDAAFRLPFDGPMHPRDPVDDWRPRDLARRTTPPG